MNYVGYGFFPEAFGHEVDVSRTPSDSHEYVVGGGTAWGDQRGSREYEDGDEPLEGSLPVPVAAEVASCCLGNVGAAAVVSRGKAPRLV